MILQDPGRIGAGNPRSQTMGSHEKRNCESGFLPLGFSDDQSCEKSTSLRGKNRLRMDPQWFPGFLNYFSWMFLERLRNKSELVGSEETGQVLTKHPRYVTLFC